MGEFELKGFLNYLGNSSFNTLSERIIIQKKIYLLQRFGLDLGYSFDWYHYGPYSSALSKDVFNMGPVDSSSIELTESQGTSLVRFSNFLGDEKNDLRFLELSGSLVFIKEKNPFSNDAFIFERLLFLKPHFSSEEINSAWNRIREFKIV